MKDCNPVQDAYSGLTDLCTLPVTGTSTLEVGLVGLAVLVLGVLIWVALPVNHKNDGVEEGSDE